MIRLGYHDEGDNFCEVAHLTEIGDFILREERIDRNPIFRTSYNIFGHLYD